MQPRRCGGEFYHRQEQKYDIRNHLRDRLIYFRYIKRASEKLSSFPPRCLRQAKLTRIISSYELACDFINLRHSFLMRADIAHHGLFHARFPHTHIYI